MTSREQEILEIIRKNPTIEQNDIADSLGIARSTVSVHINNLQKKGLLLGRGYIVQSERYVVGIGAANVDIYGKSDIALRPHFDHPARIYTSVGGVTRNVCENLARLKGNVKLIAAVGDDVYGQMIVSSSEKAGIDCSNVMTVSDSSSGIFMQILDENNDMHIALCDMSVNANLTKEYIQTKDSLLNGAGAIIFDPSLSNELIEEILASETPCFLDPVSDVYALKIKPYLDRLYCIKCNRTEAEVLSDISIENDNDVEKAADIILSKGVSRVYISLGSKGAFYKDCLGNRLKKALKPVTDIKNASGAGDSFFAAVVYSYLNDFSYEKTLDYALAAGSATIMSEKTINPQMSVELIENILKEN